MHLDKNKATAISIVILFVISMATSVIVMPNARAHTPAWQIPTYAQIVAAPDPVGVGQLVHVYLWLEPVYGVAGGSSIVAGTNGSTASAALLSNNYRFLNYHLKITSPTGKVSETTFPIISDTTSSMFYQFTPDEAGKYILNFTYPGQVYGANGNGYSGSSLINDTYLPSSAQTILTVSQDPIPAAINGYPLPEEYWTRPIYGENTNWYTISSNWLGTGSPVMSEFGDGYISGISQSRIQRNPGDAVGSLTAHVMWTKPLEMGGVVGGNQYETPGVAYFEGSAYNNRIQNPIIINGILYYTEPDSFSGITSGPTDAIDLRTGQLVWSRKDVPALSFGYIFNLWNPDQHGVYPPILFTSNFARGFSAATGEPLFNVTNVPNGAVALGPNGEHIRYVFANAGNTTNPQWYLASWNSSRLIVQQSNPYTFGASLLSPSYINASNGALLSAIPIPETGTTATLPNGTSIAVPRGSSIALNANIPITSSTSNPSWSYTTYDWNVSTTWLNTMPIPNTYNSGTGQYVAGVPGTNPVTVLSAFLGDRLICRNGSLPVGFAANNPGAPNRPYTLFAVNLNQSVGQIGSILWMNTVDPPPGNVTLSYGGADPTALNGAGRGVFIFGVEETINWIGFSMTTGKQIWGPTTPQHQWDYYGNPIYPYVTGQVANGFLYSTGFSGITYAYDLSTGNVVWTYGNDPNSHNNSTYAGLNTFYGDYPTFINGFGNGVIYLVTTEHTITDPIYKGSMARAINATDGTEIWKLNAYTGEFGSMSYAFADGYNNFFNGYDDQIYTVGRGPSATTVNAPNIGVDIHRSVVISGTVTDISAGTKQNNVAPRFPNGLPCADDAIMTEWMGYVYQQKPLPSNFYGVEVTLDVIDSNGNYRTIGTARTDASGSYSYNWVPDIEGKYTVIATFHGTKGYWPSYSEASFAVDPAAATPAPTEAPADSTADLYFVPAIAGLFVLVIIVLVLVVMSMLRKHP